MGDLETKSNELTKGLTEMLIRKMTANAWSVLTEGVCGPMLCCLWGSGSPVGGFYEFFWGWGRAVVLL